MQTSSSRIPGQTAGEGVPPALGPLAGELPTPIAAFDRHGRFSYVNAAFSAFGGPKHEAFAGAAPADVLPAPLARRIEAGVARALAGEPSRARVARAPGAEKLELSCFPIHDHDGKVAGAGCQLTGTGPGDDLARLGPAGAASMIALVEASQDAIVSVGMDRLITSWNPAAERLFGWTAEEAVGRPANLIAAPGESASQEAFLRAALAGKAPPATEVTRARKDGSLVHVRVSPAPVRDAAGKIVGGSAIFHDLSAEHALATAEHYFRALVLASAEIVWAATPDGVAYPADQFTGVEGHRWVDYTGQAEPDIAGFGWLAAVHPDDRDRVRLAWLDAVEEQAPYAAEFRVLRRDGKYRTMVGRAVPVRGQEGALLGWVGTCVDIEETRRVEQGLWRQSGQFALLSEAAARITAESTLQEALRVTAEQARNVIGAHMAAVVVTPPDGGPETSAADTSELYAGRDVQSAARLWSSLAADDDGPTRLSQADIESDPAAAALRGRPPQSWLRAWLAAPLVDTGGRRIGLIQLFDRYDGDFTSTDEAILAQLARLSSLAIERLGLSSDAAEAHGALRALMDAIPASVWVLDGAGSLIYFNKQWALAADGAQDLESSFEAAVHPDDLQRVLGTWSRAFAAGEPFEMEYRIHEGGGYQWKLLRALPVRGEGGAIEQWIGASVDIEGRKRAEEQLATSEARLRELTDAMPQIVCRTSASGEAEYFNGRWTEYTGRSAPASSGWGWLGAVHPEDAPAVREAWQDSVRSGDPLSVQFRLRGKDGVDRWHLHRARPLRNAAGRVVNWFATSIDVHEQKVAEERDELLSGISRRLALSLELESTLEEIADGVVPALGTIALVDAVGPDGQIIRSAAVANSDAGSMEAAMRYGTRLGAGDPISRVLRNGIPEIALSAPSREQIGTSIASQELFLRIAPGGYAVLPLQAHGDIVGALTVASGDPGHVYRPEDIRLAEEVASRAALAVANARLFGQARRTAAALATSEERHRTLTEALPQLVWQSRPDGQVDYFNRQWSAYTGLPAAEALGWGWTQAIHEDDLSATVTGWNHALVAGADFVAELRLRRHDGTYRWHLARAVPMRGQLDITSWFGSLTDIHDQKVVQEELQRLAGSLAVSEARYRTLVDAVPASIALMDTSGANTFHNRGWLEYTGATAEELREAGWQSFVHPEDRDAVLEQWREASVSGEPYDSEYRARRHDGEYCWHLARTVPLRNADGEPEAWLTAATEIDQVKQAQAALIRAIELKDEFLGLVSHELRTPLTTILGQAQFMLGHEDALDAETRLGSLADIEHEAERLQRLVVNMLILAGIERSGGVMTEPLLVQRLIPPVIDTHLGAHPSREVRCTVPDDLPPAEGERTHFEQVLGNLVGNAEKYSPPGEPIDVVAAEEKDGFIAVRVLDRGPGIREEELGEVFKPFFRSQRTAHDAPGAGLGLAVCHRLIEAQGGRIWVRARQGGGTEFGFALPPA